MRILLVAPPWLTVPPRAYGGIEWVVSGLADGLADAGHDVTLLASGGSETRAHLESVFEPPPFELLGDACVESVHALTAYKRMRDFDLVHDHSRSVGPALASLLQGPPVAHTLHNPWTNEQTRLARLVSPPVHLVAISHDQARRAPPDLCIDAVIHNGIPVERYPFREEKSDYLLFVGRACREKGPEAAIEIARRSGRRLVVAMKVNQRDEHLYFDEVVRPLLAEGEVEYVPNPQHQRKVELMTQAAAVVAPIDWPEPFGLVMVEANACGTPVVAFDSGAASEVLADPVTGFVVPAGDIEAFCEALDRVGEIHPADCRRHVIQRFSAQRMVRDHLRLYESLVGGDDPSAIVDIREEEPHDTPSL